MYRSGGREGIKRMTMSARTAKQHLNPLCMVEFLTERYEEKFGIKPSFRYKVTIWILSFASWPLMVYKYTRYCFRNKKKEKYVWRS